MSSKEKSQRPQQTPPPNAHDNQDDDDQVTHKCDDPDSGDGPQQCQTKKKKAKRGKIHTTDVVG